MLALLVAAQAPLWIGRFPAEGAVPAPWRVVEVGTQVTV